MGGERQRKKDLCCGRINRLAAFLLFWIAVMLIVILIPSWERFRFRSEKTACIQALKSAEDGLIIEFLSSYKEGTVEDARKTLDAVMPERPNICPAGGTVYLIKGDDGIYKPVCGLHDSDLKERTRLNASRARDLLLAALEEEERAESEEEIRSQAKAAGTNGKNASKGEKKSIGNTDPDSSSQKAAESDEEQEFVEIRLNGRDLECVKTEQEADIRRGTRTTFGYEGVVAFYGLAGEGDFADIRVRSGRLAYFLYADEECCAIWRANDGWSGTAYNAY